MNFEKFFKIISYLVVACGMFALFFSGGIGILITLLFIGVLILAWFLEDSRWQISERLGVVLIFVLIPLFYIDWKFKITGLTVGETAAAGSLARLILLLAGIKILQRKSERDWVFIYLISFFEILLAAGLSISPLFIVSLILYLLCIICAIVAFEIRKTSRVIAEGKIPNKSGGENSETTKVQKRLPRTKISNNAGEKNLKISLFRLPATAVTLLLIITVLAVPMFFMLPRVGGAGFGKSSESLSATGFSDSVRLGEIARIQQNNEVVMRVKIDDEDKNKLSNVRWRGVALDRFDNQTWSKSANVRSEAISKAENDFFKINSASSANNLITQTIYLEPLDSPVLFGLKNIIVIRGDGFQIIFKDSEGAVTAARNGSERANYKVFSDGTLPDVARLQSDNAPYTRYSRYLQLPENIDARIGRLAQEIVTKTGAKNRYDKARAIESYLKTNFGYTLDLKAGGEQPLADFLFKVKEGHCEYFATALAVMLRTQGIATRIVNGFQAGEYNETADVYVVRQREAHSWVEVYFPQENVWATFDPTPAAGQFSDSENAGMFGGFNKYVEALETFWVQYVLSYDNQEQKSLLRSFRNNMQDIQAQSSTFANVLQYRLAEWWKQARGDEGLANSARAIGTAILYLLGLVLAFFAARWIFLKLRAANVWQRFVGWLQYKNDSSIVEFYERMQRVLVKKGFRREPFQTPLEFAFALNMPEAVKITEKYNRVRYGEQKLTSDEADEIENWLGKLEKSDNAAPKK